MKTTMMQWKTYVLMVLAMQTGIGLAIIAYDCSEVATNVTTLALNRVDDCEIPDQEIQTRNISIRLFQIAEIKRTSVIHSKIMIYRHVVNCGGWLNYEKPVENGDIMFLVGH